MSGDHYSINTTWYLELNRIARHSGWAHGVMAFYSHFFGLALLALLLLAAWWKARSDARPARAVAGVLWAAGGTVLAWVVAHMGLKPLVDERRPYLTLSHVEVLLHRTSGPSFPSGHATIAGAVIVGLWLARRWLAAVVATVLGLLLCFGRVYTGMHYPLDVLAGLMVGAVVVAVLWLPVVAALTWWDSRLLHTGLAPLVATTPRRGRSSIGRHSPPPGATTGAGETGAT